VGATGRTSFENSSRDTLPNGSDDNAEKDEDDGNDEVGVEDGVEGNGDEEDVEEREPER
jgi:hypothetical protein